MSLPLVMKNWSKQLEHRLESRLGLKPGRLTGRRIRASELAFFTRQLAALLGSGIPLEKCLLAMAEQARPAVREVFLGLQDGLREGLSFQQALGRFPLDFSESYRGLVGVGESSGSLSRVLARLADDMEAANSLRHSLLSALAYPLIVSAVALIVVLALMAYVVPQIVSVLESQQQDLPLLTRSLMGLSSFLQAYGKALLIVVALFLISVMGSYRRFLLFRLWFDQKLLYVFLIGPMLQTAESARLASSLGTSLSGGVNLLRALRTSSLVLRNYYLQERLTLATQWVREGAELGRSMAQTGGFPPLLVQLISTGERSGELAKMLSLAAEQMTQDLRRRTLLLTSFLEPALILGMGLVVLLIVLAVMMPLIEMNTLLR